jgi:LysM repeat protein
MHTSFLNGGHRRTGGNARRPFAAPKDRTFIPAGLPRLVGLFILITALAFLYGCSNGNSRNDSAALKVKIHQLEERLNALEASVEQRTQLQNQVSQLQQKVAQLDAEIKSARIEKAARPQPESVGKKETAAKPEPPAPMKKEQPAVEKNKPGQEAGKRYHTVKSGDTLYSIARNNKLSVEELLRLNHMKKSQIIYPGQKLVVGSGG